GKFWEYHDYLYTHQNGENQGAFSLASLKNFAAELGLKESDFNNCLGSKKYEKAVRDETNRGKNYGVDRTPTLFINGEKIVGALPYDVFASKIDEALQKK
ncbi:MAG: thioredoxin domain-containing protein, partial [Deltaproteobacteria bacterium]|nr:thioredoxin domain-containing protein [Deltaproteobacteria bacterium]